MKSILISLLIVGLVGGLAGGGMFAYFSDTETSTGNTFTAGTIDILLSGEDVNGPMHGSVQHDFKPCETAHLDYTIKNVGQNPADIWKKIYDVTCYNLVSPESDDIEDPLATINDISGVMHFSMEVTIGTGGDVAPLGDSVIYAAYPMTEDENYLVTEGSHQLTGLGYTPVAGKYIYLGKLGPGDTFTVRQNFHMDGATTNWAQGDQMAIDEDFFALQAVGNPVLPAPQLSGYTK